MIKTKLYPTAPKDMTENVEETLQKKTTDMKSLNIYVDNIEGMITYFKDKNSYQKTKITNMNCTLKWLNLLTLL